MYNHKYEKRGSLKIHNTMSMPKLTKTDSNNVEITNTCDIESPPTQKPGGSKKPLSGSNSINSCDGEGSTSFSILREHRKSTTLNMLLIIFLGAATCAAFLAIGIKAAKEDQESLFERHADDLVNRIQRSIEDYVTAASWIHGRCRGRNFTREEFRQTYEYLINSGLDFQAAQFDPNITNEERPAAEEEAREFYEQNYPSVNYRGFVGFNYANSTSLEPRNQADHYFPIHYMEPVIGNEPAIDLDYHASGSRKQTVLFCMNNGLPALTDRLVLVQETTESAYGVVLMHPGFALSSGDDVWPKDLASIVIRFPDLLRRAATDASSSSLVYIYDAADSTGVNRFLGAAQISVGADLHFLPEVELHDLRESADTSGQGEIEDIVNAANKEWIIVVQAPEDAYQANYIFVTLGGSIIFVASVCLACWVHTNSKRMNAFNKMRSEADAERAALILDNARKATRTERELNDFIAHEVSTVYTTTAALVLPGKSFLTTFLSTHLLFY
jgi:CHASE1-domain containing sensor protein